MFLEHLQRPLLSILNPLSIIIAYYYVVGSFQNSQKPQHHATLKGFQISCWYQKYFGMKLLGPRGTLSEYMSPLFFSKLEPHLITLNFLLVEETCLPKFVCFLMAEQGTYMKDSSIWKQLPRRKGGENFWVDRWNGILMTFEFDIYFRQVKVHTTDPTSFRVCVTKKLKKLFPRTFLSEDIKGNLLSLDQDFSRRQISWHGSCV